MANPAAFQLTHTAAHYFLKFLEDSVGVLGYRSPKSPQVEPSYRDGKQVGHHLFLPRGGSDFSDLLKQRIEAYGASLSLWGPVEVSFDWTAAGCLVDFVPRGDVPSTSKPKAKTRGRHQRTAGGMGRLLQDSGFMVREPTPARVVTLGGEYSGTAVVFKRPGTAQHDDQWVPMLADVFARDSSLKADLMADGDMKTVFFTGNRRYAPSLFERTPTLRLLVPKSPRNRFALASRTYRACLAVAKHYRGHFLIPRRPLSAWAVQGHSIILEYRKGSGGRVVEDAYYRNVNMLAERLMRKFGLNCALQYQPATRALVVTFFDQGDAWFGAH